MLPTRKEMVETTEVRSGDTSITFFVNATICVVCLEQYLIKLCWIKSAVRITAAVVGVNVVIIIDRRSSLSPIHGE